MKKKSTTRRGFVKEVAAGTAAVAVAGAFVEALPAAQGGKKGSVSVDDRLNALEQRLQHLEDIQAINRLQCCYNYYVEHMMKQEIIDCFADSPDVLLDWLEGKWKGKEGVCPVLSRWLPTAKRRKEGGTYLAPTQVRENRGRTRKTTAHSL